MVSKRAEAGSREDPTIYPVDELVPESSQHDRITALLRELVQRWHDTRGIRAFVGSSQFIYWVQYVPANCVAPDLYVLPGVAPDEGVTAWKVWETGIRPSFTLEVVSNSDPDKDYVRVPKRCAELGVEELVVFDPQPEEAPHRHRWQVFRRQGGSKLTAVEVSDDDRVRSEVLGCWLRAVGAGTAQRLRLGLPPSGDVLFPTGEEAERAARLAAEAKQKAAEAEREAERNAREPAEARHEAERKAHEAERSAREAAEAERDALLRELERLRPKR